MDLSLSGKLLVASPLLDESAFRRTVVLVCEHDARGALGLVLNRPLRARLEALPDAWHERAAPPAVIFRGGPVAVDSALALGGAPPGSTPPSARPVLPGVALLDLEDRASTSHTSVAQLRVFSGYAGWSGGQLEVELEQDAWHIVAARPADAFDGDPGTLWQRVLRRQAGALGLLATFPRDPAMN
ncbi:MAG: hypothetical protein FJ035_09510 [Chloroflexi bacterium]|nr:hypothetical protein [Chloroflexota bacterium]